MAKKKHNKIKDVKRGIQKIKLWTLVLLGLLVFSGGLRLGVSLPKIIDYTKTYASTALEKILEFLRLSVDTVNVSEVNEWMAVAIGLFLGVILLFIIHPFLPKKEQSLKELFKDITLENLFELPTFRNMMAFVYLLIAATSTCIAYKAEGEAVKILSALVGMLTFIVVVYSAEILIEVCGKRNSEDYVYFEQNKKNILTITTVVGALVIGLPLVIPEFWGFTPPELFSRKDMSEYYAAILSLTFISISVMGVLSDKSVIIYWENVAESKLIKPVLFSFAAYTFYSVGAAVGAGICLISGKSVAFAIFFTINLAAIIALTFTMVDVYYDRGGKKKKLTKELQEDVADYLWFGEDTEKEEHYINRETGEKYTKQEIKDKEVGKNRYQEKMMLLRQNIRRAKDEHDLTYLKEVYELYQKNTTCFNTPEGILIAKMLFTDCTEENWPLVIKCITESVEERIEKQKRTEDLFKEGFSSKNAKWNQDEEMWIALSRTPYLYQLLQPTDKENIDRVEFNEVMLPIVKRLVALYNDMATHINLNSKEKVEYLQATNNYGFIKVITEQGKEPTTRQIYGVFSKMFDIMVPIECITTHMMRIICAILKNSRDYELDTIEGIFRYFPITNWYTPYLDYITEDKCAKVTWENCFPELESQ